ncbi:MAG: Ig-like domain-containing protein [Eubacterium sp.]|nr:Ig-like domain-containing protein [Eubacterium sp.]
MIRKKIGIMLSLLLIAGLFLSEIQTVSAAKPMLNYSSYNIYGYYSFQLILNHNSKKVKWSSSNPKVAKVTKSGKVSSVANGKCVITASAGGKKYRCKVKVTGLLDAGKNRASGEYTKTSLDLSVLKVDVSAVVYDKQGNAIISNAKKNTVKLKLYNVPKKKGKKLSVKWKSSKKKIATVNRSGTITPKKKGKCSVYAIVKGKKYKCTVVVTDYNQTVSNHTKGDLNSAAERIDTQRQIYKNFQMVNQARLKKKVMPLKIDTTLNRIADIRAKECAPEHIGETPDVKFALDKNFSHSRPDGTPYYTAYQDVNFSFPAHYCTGENIAHSSERSDTLHAVAKRIFEGLWASNSHKKNILRREYTKIGVGYYKAAMYKSANGVNNVESFWTQEFFGIS